MISFASVLGTQDELKEMLKTAPARVQTAGAAANADLPAPKPLPQEQKPAARVDPSNLPNNRSSVQERSELIASVFRALDRTGRGVLSAEEMLPFATHTGFDGSDQDWQTEFGLLAKECNSPQGIPLREFERLANDKSDAGIYCSDDELRSLLAKVPVPKPAVPTAAPPAASPPSSQPRPGVHVDPNNPPNNRSWAQERSELISSVFRALDRTGRGVLSAEEMLQFATHTGFDGSDQDWQTEFVLLAKECNSPQGIPLREFERMANDKSDDGCYCSDDELRSLMAKISVPKPAVPTPAPPIASPPSAQPRPGTHVDPTNLPNNRSWAQERSQLIGSVFRALDRTGKGVLSAEEMLPFATHTGFDGSDQDWQTEFGLLAKECNSPQGIPLREFERMANDKSDDGCYCSDDELRSLLAKISVPKPAVPTAAPPAASPPSSQPRPGVQVDPNNLPNNRSWAQERSELIGSVFRALDRTGKGVLSSEEMLQFATHTGFDGSDQDWQREFDMLTRECNSPLGIPLREFERLANDKSDDGCYCSDDELRSLLAKASVPKQAALKPAALKPAALMNSLPSSQPRPALHMPSQQSGIQPGSRAELIRSVFRALDRAGKGVLSSEEMLQFATHTGFDGSDQDWQREFDMLTRECNSPLGIPLREFERLANDKSDEGCYCSDDELRSLLAKASVPKQAAPKPAAPKPAALMNSMPSSQPKPAPAHTPALHMPSQQSGIQPGSRAELIRSVFRALDRAGKGVLSSEEMLQFATHTGFDGSDQDWQSEFDMLTRECNSPQGIPLREFERLANDKSDDGCYCSDDELRSLLAKASVPKQAAPKPAAPMSSMPSSQPRPAPQPTPAPQPRPAEHVPSQQPNIQPDSRAELIRSVFRALDRTGRGVLSAEEMLQFATHTGFDGSDQDWQTEFGLLAKECNSPQGIPLREFERLANDKSDDGCYCSDDELRSLLAKVSIAHPTANAASETRRTLIHAVPWQLSLFSGKIG